MAIQGDYTEAGDTVMAAQIGRYLEAFEAYAAGLGAIKAIDTIACEEGVQDLRKA